MGKKSSIKHEKLTTVKDQAVRLKINDDSRIILFSDVHRGDGTWADEFASNQTIFSYVLDYYFRGGFTYIEVGDGEELGKNSQPRVIHQAHDKVYRILRDYYLQDRYYYIYGNHDIPYQNPEYVALHLSTIQSDGKSETEILFPGITVHQALLLDYEPVGGSILVTHGHQGELINDRIWRISRFLLRNLWRPLQMIGVQNPYRVSTNQEIRRDIESQLIAWSKTNQQPLICGHTHCAYFPKPGETAYFNTGSCVHPQWITGIELDQGQVMLIQWRVKPDQRGSLFIQREILEGPEKLSAYFDQTIDQINHIEVQLPVELETQ
jgi:UDP-2,3-diacylglucosamine pyrophosphatase LpxH